MLHMHVTLLGALLVAKHAVSCWGTCRGTQRQSFEITLSESNNSLQNNIVLHHPAPAATELLQNTAPDAVQLQRSVCTCHRAHTNVHAAPVF
jgi:predicted NAD/FAD-dependent oxidoreductase